MRPSVSHSKSFSRESRLMIVRRPNFADGIFPDLRRRKMVLWLMPKSFETSSIHKNSLAWISSKGLRFICSVSFSASIILPCRALNL